MSTSTERARECRRRRREDRMPLPRREVSRERVDALVEARLLPEWDDDNPQAVADAEDRLLDRVLLDPELLERLRNTAAG
jgi:hypothetical protein